MRGFEERNPAETGNDFNFFLFLFSSLRYFFSPFFVNRKNVFHEVTNLQENQKIGIFFIRKIIDFQNS